MRWVEEDFQISGQSSGQSASYVALYTVVVQPPEKEEELLINPLGIRIADLSYARETEVSKE